MSNPISNFIRIKSSKEIFESIVNTLIDEEREETTYSKFWPAPEGLTEREEYEWRMENHQCTKGTPTLAKLQKTKQVLFMILTRTF